MGKKTALISRLKVFKQKVSKIIPVQKIILFGSHAQGKTRKWSDVDLLIVSPAFQGLNPLHRGLELYDYWDINRPVDFLCYTPYEFQQAKKRIGLAAEALRNGIVL